MASLITLKRRIKAAQNVSKTTKAMQMIAASKFKKAQNATLASRPYVDKLVLLQNSIAAKTPSKSKFKYLNSNNSNRELLIILSPDKGLCGSLITNLLKEFLSYNSNTKSEQIIIGKKIETKLINLTDQTIATFQFGNNLPTFDMVYPVRKLIDDNYLSGKVSAVKILYTNFTSIFSQKPEIASLLPIQIDSESGTNEYKFEPGVDTLLPEILSHFIEMSIYQYLLESHASEQASRMIAMKNATENANDITDMLKLEYNKSRQAKITNELLDITSGAVNQTN